MARGRKPSQSVAAKKLAEALAFVHVAARRTDQPYQPFVRLAGKWAVATDGVLSAGHPIEEELNVNAHGSLLIDALAKCGKTLTLTELESGRLSVKGDKLRALVPCMGDEYLPPVAPDPAIADIDDRIKVGFETVAVLASEAGEKVFQASVLLQSMTCAATNGHTCVEYWHGVDLPPNLVLPKVFVTAVCAANKPLTKFGFSESSVTFYFDDGSWLKTVRYADQWPDIGRILNVESFPVTVPPDFFDGIEAVMSFNELEYVTFDEGRIMSHFSEDQGAQYEVEGLPGGKQFPGKVFKQLRNVIATLDITTYADRAVFFGCPNEAGNNLARGVMTAVVQQQNDPGQAQEEQPAADGWGQTA